MICQGQVEIYIFINTKKLVMADLQMKKMSILLIFAFVLLTGCNDDYDIRVSNSSGAPIREVALQWGNLWPFGTIANGSDATFLFANDMEPNYFEKTVISWVDECGNKYSKEVSVPPKPKFKRSLLIFNIGRNGQVSVFLIMSQIL